MYFFLLFALSVLTTWLLLFASIPWLQRSLPDLPNARSSHRQSTPRGGGLVFVLIASITSIAGSSLAFVSSSAVSPVLLAPLLLLPLALVGLIDDRFDLPALWRYAVQLLTALVLILLSPLVLTSASQLPLLIILLIAVTALINFTNFMDGLDGLLAGCMAVALSVAAYRLEFSLSIWSLVGSLLGFLFWNWSPAKVFMGDVGSTFLGGVFALLILQSPTWSEAFALLLLATPLLGDAFFCVSRRLLARQHIFRAHRLHLYQRLHQAGWPHFKISILYIVATFLLAIALFMGGLPWVIICSLLELLLGIWLDQQVAVPFVVASRS